MTNELIAFGGQSAIDLADLETELLAEQKREVTAYKYEPTKYSVATGGMIGFANKSTKKLVESITGIVLISQRRRTFYESKKISNERPICSSPDGVYGYLLNDVPNERFSLAMRARIPHPGLRALGENKPVAERFPCAPCPLAQFGSAFQDPESTDGQGCKESRWLMVIPDGMQRPVVITVPTMSLKAWDTHCSAMEDGNPLHQYFCARMRLEVAEGSNSRYKFGVIRPIFLEWLDRPTIAAVVAVRRQYAEYAKQAQVDASDVYGEENGTAQDYTPGTVVDADSASDIPF